MTIEIPINIDHLLSWWQANWTWLVPAVWYAGAYLFIRLCPLSWIGVKSGDPVAGPRIIVWMFSPVIVGVGAIGATLWFFFGGRK